MSYNQDPIYGYDGEYVRNSSGFIPFAPTSMTPVPMDEVWKKPILPQHKRAGYVAENTAKHTLSALTAKKDTYRDKERAYIQKLVDKVGLPMDQLALKYPTLYLAAMGMEPDPILKDDGPHGTMYGKGGMYDESLYDTVITRDGDVLSVKDAYGLCTYAAY